MDEYIKKEAAVKVAEKYGLANGSALGRHTGLADCIASEIADIPAADVAPVVHARWLDAPWLYYGAKQYVCSGCRNDKYWRKRDLHFKEPYCPNCGAKMDGGDDND